MSSGSWLRLNVAVPGLSLPAPLGVCCTVYSVVRAAVVLPLALAGVLAGHQVSYERAAADLGEHAGMTMSGQSWLPALPSVLLVLSLVLLAGVLVAKRASVSLLSPWPVFALQSGSLVVLEVVDRLLHGCCLFPSFSQALAGLALQLPAALVVALLGVVLVPLLVALAGLPRPALVAPATAKARPLQRAYPFVSFLLARALHSRGPPRAAVAL